MPPSRVSAGACPGRHRRLRLPLQSGPPAPGQFRLQAEKLLLVDVLTIRREDQPGFGGIRDQLLFGVFEFRLQLLRARSSQALVV